MDVKQAVKTSKEYVIDLFSDEQIEHVGLEEVKFDQHLDVWKITIGFSRPWDRNRIIPGVTKRSYKIVQINDKNGHVMSVVHRVLADAG